MTKRMLIDASHPEETRVVIAKDNFIEEFDFTSAAKAQIKGNIYLAKVTRVEPSLQAAFVEYGGGRQGFLSFSEIHPDYYQIPIADRKRLMEEEDRLREEAEARKAAQEDAPDVTTSDDAETMDVHEDDNHNEYMHHDDTEQNISEEDSAYAEDDNNSEENNPTDNHLPNDDDTASEAITSEESDNAIAEDSDDSDDSEEDTQQSEGSEQENGRGRGRRRGRRRTSSSRGGNNSRTQSASQDVVRSEPIDETMDDDDADNMTSSQYEFFKRYKIQEVIKRGQIILVQAIKEERGNKGASLTTYLSIPGRYCVLMPNSPKGIGISRKISKHEERRRLREIAAEMKESGGMSAIIRTAGVERTRMEIKRDYEYLLKLWNQIREDALASAAPALVYEESDILKRTIRDSYDTDIEEIIVQGGTAYNSAKEFMKIMMPSHAAKVKEYRHSMPIFSEYDIEPQLQQMYQPIAKLKSGGYIVISQTEALIAVDVNSGRSTSERNVEETAYKTNLEAAAEIARQLRLRDLGGLIVVDFIDMYYGKNRRNVERTMRDALRQDRAKIQMGSISSFGLMELSRQRLRPSISETSSNTCPHCNGTGYLRSMESLSIEIIRTLEKEASTDQFKELRVILSPEVALYVLNHFRKQLLELELKFDTLIGIRSENDRLNQHYSIEKLQRSQGEQREREQMLREAALQQPEEQTEEDGSKRKRRRGGRGRGRSRNKDDQEPAGDAFEDVLASELQAFENNEMHVSNVIASTPDGAVNDASEQSAPQEDTEEQKPARRTRGGRRRTKDYADTKDSTPAVIEEPADAAPATDGDVTSTAAKPKRPARSRVSRAKKLDAPESVSDFVLHDAPKVAAPSVKMPPIKESQQAIVQALQSAPMLASTTTDTSAPQEEAKPARKGWWRRVIATDD